MHGQPWVSDQEEDDQMMVEKILRSRRWISVPGGAATPMSTIETERLEGGHNIGIRYY